MTAATVFYWAILAAFIWGIVPLFEKLGLQNTEPIVGLFYRSLGVIVGIVFLFMFKLRISDIKAVNMRSVLLLIFSGFLASIVGQICFYNSLKSSEISKIVPITGSYPLVTFFVGILLLHESFNPLKLLGAFLIVAGMWLLKIS